MTIISNHKYPSDLEKIYFESYVSRERLTNKTLNKRRVAIGHSMVKSKVISTIGDREDTSTSDTMTV